jgi:hypothetical protein
MINRRAFLSGLGTVVTLPLIRKVEAHIRNKREPLLLTPERAELTLNIYPDYSGETDQYRITMGPDLYDPPDDALTWRQYMSTRGLVPSTVAEIEALCEQFSLDPDEFDEPLSDMSWIMAWEMELSPAAKAYSLLEQLDLGPDLSNRRDDPCIYFNEGSHPGNSDRWVEAKDAMSVSLLQVRLIELGQPIKIVNEDG